MSSAMKEHPGSVKAFSLIALCFQSAIVLTVMHYSRVSIAEKDRYSTSVAVLLCECIKCSTSFALRFRELSIHQRQVEQDAGGETLERLRGPLQSSFSIVSSITKEIFTGDSWKLGVPAILYVIQNTSVYIALSHLDSATFQVISQSKIVITALLSTLLLGRTFSRQRWFALTLLAIGIIIVQLQSTDSGSGSKLKAVNATVGHDTRAGAPALHYTNPTIGLLAVFIASGISSLAGVYLELVLKTTPTSLWTRNIQLSLYSLVPAIIGIFAQNFSETMSRGFFRGFSNPIVMTTVFGQAMGGLLVSMVLQYADNILKSFATSIAILVSVPLAIWLFDFQMTLAFGAGAACVIASTLLYSRPDPNEPKSAMANGSSRHWHSNTEDSDLELATASKAMLTSVSTTPTNSSNSRDYRIIMDNEVDNGDYDGMGPARSSLDSLGISSPAVKNANQGHWSGSNGPSSSIMSALPSDRATPPIGNDIAHFQSSPVTKSSKHMRGLSVLEKPIGLND